MKELVGKLTALDPVAGDAVRVIAYFDALMDGRAGLESLVRGAAVLAGVPAGCRVGDRTVRVLADGRRGPEQDARTFTKECSGDTIDVWLERAGPALANDDMIRERLLLAVERAATARGQLSSEAQAVEVLLTADLHDERRAAAEARLQLEPLAQVRAVAAPSAARSGRRRPSTVLATPWGPVRGSIVSADVEDVPAPAGVGLAGRISELHRSWRSALVGLALVEDELSVRCVDDLGPLLHLTDLINDAEPPPTDVVLIDTAVAHGWPLPALKVLAEGGSVRAVAAAAGLHHSSVHAKLPDLARTLRFDPMTPLGRTRLFSALLLRRLAHARFT